MFSPPKRKPRPTITAVSAVHGRDSALFQRLFVHYHALQVSFNKRFSRGIQFEGSYTKAKAIDNGMSHQNSYNIRESKSLADYDIAQRFVVGYIL